jgi:negative regulator of flagellin synthesis FlgM
MSHTHGITNNQALQTTLNAAERTVAAKSTAPGIAAAATSTPQSSASTTNLSGAGTLLASANTDDVRADKVAALKSAIDSGTYNVPAGDVADKLIDHLLE